MIVHLRRSWESPAMAVEMLAVPREGETIIFADDYKDLYNENEEPQDSPEWLVKQVSYTLEQPNRELMAQCYFPVLIIENVP